MDNKKLEIIQQLMDELQGEMEYSKDDFEHRLGRKKPQVEVVKIEGKLPIGEEGMDEELEEPEHAAMDMGKEYDEDCDYEEESPESSLKKRLMKLRA